MHKTDVVIVGAGPVGLFQVFELGLQGLTAHVVDALPQAGGQCTELYPDKPIYDIPAVVECTGGELTQKLLDQIKPFDPQLHFNQEVQLLERRDIAGQPRFYVKTSAGTEFDCGAVVIAAGGGSFTPVKLRVDGIEAFLDQQLFYRIKDPSLHANKDIVILGGGDSALDWAIALQPNARSITLVNRTDRFRAAEASVSKLRALQEQGKATIHMGVVSDFKEENQQLKEVMITLRDEARTEMWMPLDHLLIFFGMSPKLGEIENWGLKFERKLIVIDQATFQTSMPGVYAIGDINTYPGKRKLILSGFHEAALTAYAIKEMFEPGKKVAVQYTTTSPTMHDRLGDVEDPGHKMLCRCYNNFYGAKKKFFRASLGCD